MRSLRRLRLKSQRKLSSWRRRAFAPDWRLFLLGMFPASEIYVRSKVRTSGQLGIYSDLITPLDTVTTEEMLELVAQLNAREDIDGILIQLPLPKQVNAKLLLEAVSPAKDVDGFHPVNVGPLAGGAAGACSVYPGGDDSDAQAQQPADCGAECGGDRAQRYCGQADFDSAAARECDSDHLPQQDARSGQLHAQCGHSGGGDWTAWICHS